MYNLLVKSGGWARSRDTLPLGRAFEYTDDPLLELFAPEGELDLEALLRLPTIFMAETSGQADQVAHTGDLRSVRTSGKELILEYAYDFDLPSLPNSLLREIQTDLQIKDFEFSRTHWAVKDVDLYRVLLQHVQPRRPQPKVFQIAEHESIEPTLVSVMMPFEAAFDGVHEALKQLAESLDLHCRRADDIWENPLVIQDVVSLIDRSAVVICDCTGRNPNVFYEIGIAHALGREVILITQNENDIPFDLRHLRFVPYLNNGEGLGALTTRLRARLSDLI